jgi:hypothetical protein
MTQTKWVEGPPPRGLTGVRGKYDWDHIVKELQSRPGEWLLVDEEAAISLPTAIRNRKMRALKDPAWVYVVRTSNNDRVARTCAVFMSAERKK